MKSTDISQKTNGTAHFFGVRHHSPGCARSLYESLQELSPDMVLIEGPPEANLHLGEVVTPGVVPPIALLISNRERPHEQLTYPFAEYSPEWVALCYAAQAQIPSEMIDAPYSVSRNEQKKSAQEDPIPSESKVDLAHFISKLSEELRTELQRVREIRNDPLAYLAHQEGVQDHEIWWEQNFERSTSKQSLFERLENKLSPLRARCDLLYEQLKDHPEVLNDLISQEERTTECRREAHMRLRIHEACKRVDRVAVICGAWHVPALRTSPTLRSDRECLKGLKRVKCEVSWVPWSDQLLTLSSGYGAGVPAPSWYHLLWRYGEQPELAERALCEGADALRSQGHLISSASLINAAQLTQALRGVRGRSWIELNDLIDAARATLCRGEEQLLQIFKRRVSVGERYGEVPSQLINISLTRSFHHHRRQLRIRLVTNDIYDLRLSLSRPRDLEKSIFLHRAQALGLFHRTCTPSLTPQKAVEHWHLNWSPQDEVRLNQQGHRGSNLADASCHALLERVVKSDSPQELMELICLSLSAALPEVSVSALQRLNEIPRSRFEANVLLEVITQITQALGQKVSLSRLSLSVSDSSLNVTSELDSSPTLSSNDEQSIKTFDQLLDIVASKLMEMIPSTLTELSPHLKRRELGCIASLLYEAHDALRCWGSKDLFSIWMQTLNEIQEQVDHVPPLIAGRSLRCASRSRDHQNTKISQYFWYSINHLKLEELESWFIGLIASDPRTLQTDSQLLTLLDDWIGSLSEDDFFHILPMLRRAFASCEQRANESVAQELLTYWRDPSQEISLSSETLSQLLWNHHGSSRTYRKELFALTHQLFSTHSSTTSWPIYSNKGDSFEAKEDTSSDSKSA